MSTQTSVGISAGRLAKQSGEDLTQRLKEQSRLLGFQKCGIVRAEALEAEEERLSEWLARSYHGEMHWMAREPESRTDPRKVFPAARSVVVVTINYYTPHQHSDLRGTGKVSRYAWGDDYHQVVGDRLRQLLSWIKGQVPHAEGKVCVDIQPLMDKAWAARAGLGWIGKHTNLITPEYGSWVFIGELLLNLDLGYDEQPGEDHCGTCTLCIDACPTQAITEPYLLDANKCISYATIELRRPEIPDEVGSKLENWLYGCDICQDVCPWNRFEQISEESAFQPRQGRVDFELSELAELTPELYAQRFRNSAIKRAKLSGLQRNARRLRENQGLDTSVVKEDY
jgi:epoxyqueuosine reductase